MFLTGFLVILAFFFFVDDVYVLFEHEIVHDGEHFGFVVKFHDNFDYFSFVHSDDVMNRVVVEGLLCGDLLFGFISRFV